MPYTIDTEDLEKKYGKGRPVNGPAINFSSYNEQVKQWTKELIQEIQIEAGSMGVAHRENSPSTSSSLKKLKDKYGYDEEEINKVSVKFPRVLIYTTKGAGKGRGGTTGSKWVDKYNNQKSTNPKSYGKMGSGGREAKPFFNNVVDGDNGVNKLATIVAEELGSTIVNNMLIK